MASGDVRFLYEKHGRPIALGAGSPCYTEAAREIFRHNAKCLRETDIVAGKGKEYIWCSNVPGHRPYVRKNAGGRFIYNDNYSPRVGEVFLTEEERLGAKCRTAGVSFVLMEPRVKGRVSAGNKDWGFHRWLRLREIIGPGIPIVQVGRSREGKLIPGAAFLQTESFREALAILERARLVVTTDGGLHHGAAALGVPAVVIWGGYSHPRHLGYPCQTNLTATDEPCGTLGRDCDHCREAMERIEPEAVAEAVTGIIESLSP